jgi:hypothetical protein
MCDKLRDKDGKSCGLNIWRRGGDIIAAAKGVSKALKIKALARHFPIPSFLGSNFARIPKTQY